jgi:DNA-binding beta-propeller fold protein YncE
VANANSQDISAFQVTSEGTLTAVSGSPFAAGNSLALAPGGGNSLAVSASQLQGWSVDPATGAITKASTAPPPSTAELVPNSTRSLVYEVEVDPCNSGHCTDLGVSAVNNGAVTRVQSSFSMTPPQKNPQRIALDPSGHFLYTTAIAYGLGNFLGILRLGTDGHIAAQVSADTQICSSMDIAATASGSHTYVYVTCSSGGIQMAVVDNTSGAVLNTTSFATGGKAEGLAVDPSGQYLLVADTSVNTVDIFKIDPATGKLGNAFTQIPAGMSPNVLTFDSARKFVYVANGSCLVLPPATCPNDGASGLQAYSWTGSTLNALGSYSTGTNPVSLAVWKP